MSVMFGDNDVVSLLVSLHYSTFPLGSLKIHAALYGCVTLSAIDPNVFVTIKLSQSTKFFAVLYLKAQNSAPLASKLSLMTLPKII